MLAHSLEIIILHFYVIKLYHSEDKLSGYHSFILCAQRATLEDEGINIFQNTYSRVVNR